MRLPDFLENDDKKLREQVISSLLSAAAYLRVKNERFTVSFNKEALEGFVTELSEYIVQHYAAGIGQKEKLESDFIATFSRIVRSGAENRTLGNNLEEVTSVLESNGFMNFMMDVREQLTKFLREQEQEFNSKDGKDPLSP